MSSNASLSVVFDGTGPILPSNHYEFARQAYSAAGPIVDESEFEDDLRRIRYVKKAFNKYREKKVIRVDLVLNHLRVIYNVFSPEMAATKILIYHLSKYLHELKPFLIMMNVWPDRIDQVGLDRQTIWGSDIPLDQGVVDALRSWKQKTNGTWRAGRHRE